MRPDPNLTDRLARFDATASRAPASIWIERSAPIIGAAGGKLAGLLGAAKDNIDVAGCETTAGCPEYAYRAQRSARVVELALNAGATMVGKTNLDQFACGLVGTRSPYGAVPNAFNPDYVSGGSSSGSAVAVALGLVDFSFGTDTAGSGRVPAGFNNIVGLKPSRGLLSTRGVVPACQHIDCVSIFAGTVELAVDVLLSTCGFDPEDPFSRALALDAEAMPERFRFAIPDARHLEFFGDDLNRGEFAAALARLETLGGTPSEIDYAPYAAAANALYEGAWVAERYAAIRSFFDAHSQVVNPVVRSIIEHSKRYDAASLFLAMREMGMWRQQAAGLFGAADVLVVPTAPTIHTIAAVNADPINLNRQLGYYTNFVNLFDLAAIAVPSTFRSDGLPFGITLIGPAGSELRLAELAQRYHQASGLTIGATGQALGPSRSLGRQPGSTVRVAVVGAHLSGMPLNYQLLERGARCLGIRRTAPCYRLYALAGSSVPKPGLVRTSQDGAAIEVEVWELPVHHYGTFIAAIGAPLGIGTLTLEDQSTVQGFLCEAGALSGAVEITQFGGWRNYLASRPK